MQIGPYRIYTLVVDRFRLDGGAMFGSVPKPLWEKRIAADEQNRIQLAGRALVLQSADRLIFIDIGCGRKWEEKQKGIYLFEPQLNPPLEKSGIPVTDVILTHLHFDHAGGISYLDEAGAPKLSFPKANVYVQEKNWERAQHPGVRERATYLAPNIEPLKNGRLRLTKDGKEVLPGIKVFQINGHTDGMQWVKISDGTTTIAYAADLVPTAHHLPVPYVMGYDLCASTSMREKEAFLEEAVRSNWWVAFDHDADTSIVRVGRDKKGAFEVAERGELPVFVP